jgi:hypothetical protein
MKGRACMKTWSLAVLLFGVVISIYGCSDRQPPQTTFEPPATPQPSEELVLTPGKGMGKVIFGMSQAEVEGVLGRPDSVVSGGAGLVYAAKGFTVTIYPKLGVQAVTCLTPKSAGPMIASLVPFKGRTAEGIRIGSKQEEIVAAYGQPDSLEASGPQTVLVFKQFGLTFVLLDDKVEQISCAAPRPPRPAKQPSDTAAHSI